MLIPLGAQQASYNFVRCRCVAGNQAVDIKGGNGLHELQIMAVVAENFDSWLSEKLQELKTDEGVFGTYIKGILEGDETINEKTEALEGIFAGILGTVRDR